MSNTYDISCKDCKVTYWYGQYSRERGYAFVYDTEKLANFLSTHLEHNLIVTNENSQIEEIYSYEKDYSGNENSRTCKNCKAWSCEIHCEVLDIRTHEDFGCNRFEGKDG